MAELVADCPRCRSKKITFDAESVNLLRRIDHGWKHWYEVFGVCRHCRYSTILVLSDKSGVQNGYLYELGLSRLKGQSLNSIASVEGYISLKDEVNAAPPEHLPPNVESAFREGAACAAAGCYNAAGAMFRLCLDLSTRAMLPAGNATEPSAKVRRDLGLRLPWLFDHGHLPEALRELSSCIKDDGNEGAHSGRLTKADADDLLDFATALLERIYTEPERLRLARERREARHAPANPKE